MILREGALLVRPCENVNFRIIAKSRERATSFMHILCMKGPTDLR
jgi:hypothetical protein